MLIDGPILFKYVDVFYVLLKLRTELREVKYYVVKYCRVPMQHVA